MVPNFSMFQGDAPPMFPMLQGQGGAWGNVYPRPHFGEMGGNISPMWGTSRHTSHPQKNGGRDA
jgi:hypothetical protein